MAVRSKSSSGLVIVCIKLKCSHTLSVYDQNIFTSVNFFHHSCSDWWYHKQSYSLDMCKVEEVRCLWQCNCWCQHPGDLTWRSHWWSRPCSASRWCCLRTPETPATPPRTRAPRSASTEIFLVLNEIFWEKHDIMHRSLPHHDWSSSRGEKKTRDDVSMNKNNNK